jgi:hypothetical protein
VYNAGTFTLSELNDNAIISYNEVNSPGTIGGTGTQIYLYGGGVYVCENAKFIMTGGSIFNNTLTIENERPLESYGGGVYNYGSFDMSADLLLIIQLHMAVV